MNVYDNHDNCNSYPHASANVETRGEAVSLQRNAIDGVKASSATVNGLMYPGELTAIRMLCFVLTLDMRIERQIRL